MTHQSHSTFERFTIGRRGRGRRFSAGTPVSRSLMRSEVRTVPCPSMLGSRTIPIGPSSAVSTIDPTAVV